MATYSAQAAPVLRPEDVDALIVAPVTETSVAARVSTTRTTSSPKLRIPVVSSDPQAQWVPEGGEITPSDPVLDETVVEPSKVAGLTVISREAADDTDPAASEIIGDGLTRDIATRIDEAYFGAMAAPAPSGLEALTGMTTYTTPTGVTAWVDLDPFIEAEFAGPTPLTAYAAHSTDAKALAKLKTADGSNEYLLPLDPNRPGQRTINGVPLYVSDFVTVGSVWGIAASRSRVVIREDVEVTSDRSVYYTSDRVAVRAIMRLAFGFPTPASFVKVSLSAT